jgi:hypothetical protein
VSHTPGPWSVEDPFDHELVIVQAGKATHDWQFIATIPHGGKPEGDFPKVIAEANARLIAAAPDLLDLARKNLETFQDYRTLFVALAKPIMVEAMNVAIEANKAVITKATGEQT